MPHTSIFKPTIEAVIARLKADTTLTTLMGANKVYGVRTPQNTVFPYMDVSGIANPWNSKSRSGLQITLRVQCWTRPKPSPAPSPSAAAHDILAAVYASLHEQTFAVTGASMVDCVMTGFSDVVPEPDNETMQGMAEYLITVQEN